MVQVVWIIGGSEGIGFELCKIYLAQNHTLIVSARDTHNSKNLLALKKQYPQSLYLIDIDVSETKSVQEATQKVSSIYGAIDICVYNAGLYEKMQLLDWKVASFEAMAQVNYLGAVRVIDALVPIFLEQKKGHLVFNISIASYFGLAYGGGYSAPKAALLNLCESLQPELKSKAIKLQVINHGFVKTRLTQKNDFEMPQLLEPKEAAQKIYHGVMHTKSFEIKFPWALTRFISFLRLLPYTLSLKLTQRLL
ncbi:MAG: SDR family NAD(P)-dependent oxidoreductase [Sulfurospirillum sp.]|nr:SDR family NAD(P)-dependent oxidoreductase [Sulfurospirillum sp.]